MGETSYQGGCLCGAVRYRFRDPLPGVAMCHCTMCRRQSGATAVPWVTLNENNIEFTKGKPTTFKSTKKGERGFCGTCGTPLTFTHEDWPGEVDITVGSLDRPEDFPATHHIWTTTRLTWVHDDGLPSYPEGTPKDETIRRE